MAHTARVRQVCAIKPTPKDGSQEKEVPEGVYSQPSLINTTASKLVKTTPRVNVFKKCESIMLSFQRGIRAISSRANQRTRATRSNR